jgi:hypothetical protein
VEQAKSGALTLEEARDELLKLGADTGEVQKALLAITRAASKGNKLPTRSELDRMVDAGLITEERWRDTMRRLGYASVWIDAFWQLHADAGDAERG